MPQIIFALILLILPFTASAQDSTLIYKKVDTTTLAMEVYYPSNYSDSQTYPAIVFFFGGGWKSGNVNQFKPHAEYLSSRGIFCFLADYRVENRQGTPPFASLEDAKSAMRFVRSLAGDLPLDTGRIVGAGGSAGGHLAAAAALVQGYNDSQDDLSVSCIPNALVLFNPVIDNGPGGYGYERVGEEFKDFSPLHNIRKNAPPTLFLVGTQDNLIPVETAKYYQTVMQKVGSRCDLVLYKDQPHGFFNFSHKEYYIKTVYEMDKFLESLGYLEGEPNIEVGK